MTAASRDTLEAFMKPVWAGGWTLTRTLWCSVAALTLLPRAAGIGDAYGASDMVFTHRMIRLNDHVTVTEPMVWIAWTCGLVGVALVAYRRRVFHVGVVFWLLGNWFLLANEALNVKAHDRLFLFVTLALLVSPAVEGNLTAKYRSPLGRYVVLIVFCALYGSTGLTKLMHEPSWLGDGSALAYTMVERTFGRTILGAWISGQTWLVAPMAWFAILYELAFPFLVWIRSVNPWLLVLGLAFHFVTFLTLDVSAFFWVILVGYPVLLDPECARKAYGRWIRPGLSRLRRRG